MNTLLYSELRAKVREIQAVVQEKGEAEEKRCQADITAAMKNIVELCRIAGREGLLSMEDSVPKLAEDCGTHCADILQLIVDGTDPKQVEEVGLTAYFAQDMRAEKGLIYLLYLKGLLLIQSGESPHVLEHQLKEMVSTAVAEGCEANAEDSRVDVFTASVNTNRMKRMCSEPLAWDLRESGYFIIKLADYILIHMEDRDLQNFLQKTENEDLVPVLQGISGTARMHVFQCMSTRRASMLAEEISTEKDPEKERILAATERMVNALFKLRGGRSGNDNLDKYKKYESWRSFWDVFGEE